jgi:uncharacterized protein (DUF1330 family)
MVVYLFMEQINAKDEAKRQRYRKWVVEEWQPYAEGLQEQGFVKTTGWTDGTGRMMGLWEFEDMEALAKLWNDEQFHRHNVRRNELVDDIKISLCRPGMLIPPQ